MALIFYTNPQSRGKIIEWLLAELDIVHEVVTLEYGTSMKAPEYLAINPMGKVPAIVHDGKIVTEAAAICAYLADAFPEKGLAPILQDRADYYRWLFFAAGPLETAITNKHCGFMTTPEQQGMVGYGHIDHVLNTLEAHLQQKTYIAGNTFTAADIYVGSALNFWMNAFKIIEKCPAFEAYVDGLSKRPAFQKVFEYRA